MSTGPLDVSKDFGSRRATDPDMAHPHLGLDNNTMAPGGSISHPVSNGPVDSLTLKDQQGLRCQPKLWASAQPSVAMGDMGVNSEPS